jgi:hypothetical protein
METMIKIQEFKRFCHHELGLAAGLATLRDGRVRPQIPTAQLAWFTMSMVPFQLQSLLQADQFGRQPTVRTYADSRRTLVVSDSTLQRVLPTFEEPPLRALSATVWHRLAAQGLTRVTLPSGQRRRVAITDGSGFGQGFASVVMGTGQGEFPLAVEGTTTKGKELRTSRMAWATLQRTLGKGWCDVMLYDGLGFTKEDFRHSQEVYGYDLLVKTQETGLQLQEAAQDIFTHGRPGVDVEEATGFDPIRGCTYTVKVARQLAWDDEPYPFTVARVREEYVKPPKGRPAVVEFWVITTKADLTASDLRALAHLRWGIENGLFKRLNALIKSKRVYTHDPKMLTTLLRLWFLGVCCLEAFLAAAETAGTLCYGTVRVTLKLVLDDLRFSLHELEVARPSG